MRLGVIDIQRLGTLTIGLLILPLALGCDDDSVNAGETQPTYFRDVGPGAQPDTGKRDALMILPTDRSVPLSTDAGNTSGDAGSPATDARMNDTVDVFVADSGLADMGASDACRRGTVRCNGERQVERCDDFDGDGSAEWQVEMLCPLDQMCLDGVCGPITPPACRDQCQADQVRCVGDLRQQCAAGADGCLAWMQPARCPDGGGCVNGECVDEPGCMNNCLAGQTICDGVRIRRCRLVDGGCSQWSQSERCPAGLSCRLNQCRCEDECQIGLQECVGDGFRRCIPEDGCGQWGPVEACPGEQACMNGFCRRPACEHECIAPGQWDCVGDLQRSCGLDDNLCRVWGQPMPCEDGRVCRPEGCIFVCDHECDFAGTARCDGERQIQTCVRDQRTRCLFWQDLAECPAGSVCEDGRCFAN